MNQETLRLSLIRELWDTSADLVAVLALVALTNLVLFLPVGDEPLARAVLGMAFVFFAPGYALVAALFPEASRSSTGGDVDETGAPVDRFFTLNWDGIRGIDGVERVALAFGLSIALVPLLMVGLSFSPYDFASSPALLTISAATVVCSGIAAKRRWALPDDQRFHVPYRTWIGAGTRSVTDADSTFDAALNVALAVAIVLAIGTLTVAVVAPPDGELFTEFYVLTENGDGDLVAANHPKSLSPDEPERLHVGIENYERETVEYSIVVQLQRFGGDADESVVTDRAEVDRFSMRVGHNETSIRERELTVSDELTGEDLRLTFLLYDDSVPDTPTRDHAYRSLHLWVDVEAGEE